MQTQLWQALRAARESGQHNSKCDLRAGHDGKAGCDTDTTAFYVVIGCIFYNMFLKQAIAGDDPARPAVFSMAWNNESLNTICIAQLGTFFGNLFRFVSLFHYVAVAEFLFRPMVQ